MRVTFKDIEGLYAIGECGIVDLESYEEQEEAVENKDFQNFDKKELFWTVYDQIIIPTREQADVDADDTLRLLYIEDDDDTFIFHYNIDDYDESYCEVRGAAQMPLEDVVSALYDDLCNMVKELPDDEPLKQAITWDKTITVDVPEDYLKRLKSDVFYSSWAIETTEE